MEPNRYRAIAAEHAPEILYVVHGDGTIVYVSRGVSELLGYGPSELEGTRYLELVHPGEKTHASEQMDALVTGSVDRIRNRRRLRTAQGGWLLVELDVSSTRIGDERLLTGTVRDISDTLELERKLTGANAFLERLIGESPMVAFRREGPDLALTYVSPNVSEILGHAPEEVLGLPMSAAYANAHPDDRAKMRDQIDRALAGEPVEITYRRRHPAGELRWIVSTIRPDPASSDSTTLLGYMFDITSQRRIEAELEWLAMHDPLTGLANRARFESDASKHLSLSERKKWTTALLYIDLDRFKDVNDRLGHDAGDTVLKTIAERIRNTVRDGDLSARLGGDEFVVLLPDVGGEASQIAERLHAALTAPVQLKNTEATVGASVGIAFFPNDAESLENLRRRADEAMYEAKRNNDAYRFWNDLDESIKARLRSGC